MANRNIKATAKLFLDTKDAQRDAQTFVENLKDKLSSIETAVDKMTVFKDVVGYIGQIDRALSTLKAHSPDVFNSMFGGIDSGLRTQLEELFGISDSQLNKLDTLREKLATLTTSSSIKDVRSFATEINQLFTEAGAAKPFDIEKQFVGKVNAGHITLLTDAVNDFSTAWKNVRESVANGFGVGSGIGGGTVGSLSGLSKEVQAEIDNLEQQKRRLQETLDSLNQKPITISVDSSTSIAEFQKILDEYLRVQKIMNSDAYRANTGEYASLSARRSIEAERIRLANLINSFNDYMLDQGNDQEAEFATVNMKTIDGAIDYLNKFYELSKSQTAEIRQMYSDLILDIDAKLSQINVDNLRLTPSKEGIAAAVNQLQEINRLMNQMSFDHPMFDSLELQIDSIIDKIKQLATTEEQLAQIDLIRDDIVDDPSSALQKLCDILSVQVPAGAQKSQQALKDLAGDGGANASLRTNTSILAQQLQE